MSLTISNPMYSVSSRVVSAAKNAEAVRLAKAADAIAAMRTRGTQFAGKAAQLADAERLTVATAALSASQGRKSDAAALAARIDSRIALRTAQLDACLASEIAQSAKINSLTEARDAYLAI